MYQSKWEYEKSQIKILVYKFMGKLSFGGRWAPKLTKNLYNSSNWVEGYEIVMDKYTL